jgi:hypothetical protein
LFAVRCDLVDRLGVGLAARGLHHLAHEPARELGVLFGLFDLCGVGGDDLVHGGLDGAGVGDLFQAARLDDLRRVAALGVDDLEQVLGDLAGDVAGL